MRQDSPSNQPFGAQIIQTGISEKTLLVVVLFILGVALVVSILAYGKSIDALRTATAEVQALRETVRTNNAKIEILQYDQQALKAQLVAKGIYQATEH